MHKTSAIGTTDIDAMEFIPLKIGESDMMEWGFISQLPLNPPDKHRDKWPENKSGIRKKMH